MTVVCTTVVWLELTCYMEKSSKRWVQNLVAKLLLKKLQYNSLCQCISNCIWNVTSVKANDASVCVSSLQTTRKSIYNRQANVIILRHNIFLFEIKPVKLCMDTPKAWHHRNSTWQIKIFALGMKQDWNSKSGQRNFCLLFRRDVAESTPFLSMFYGLWNMQSEVYRRVIPNIYCKAAARWIHRIL